MSLANLLVLNMDDKKSLLEWSFSNDRDHLIIRDAIQSIGGGNLPSYQLDPFDPENIQKWALDHQLAHTDMNATLGIAGVDLSNINLSSPGAIEAWLYAHFNEHLTAHARIGL